MKSAHRVCEEGQLGMWIIDSGELHHVVACRGRVSAQLGCLTQPCQAWQLGPAMGMWKGGQGLKVCGDNLEPAQLQT